MVGTHKGYGTVYWGKMPINFRPRAFGREEVEGAVAYATRSFPDVLDLVPNFSVLTVGKDLDRDETAVLVLGDEREARGFRRVAGEGASRGCYGMSPCASGRGSGE
jgi:hypothetical protein